MAAKPEFEKLRDFLSDSTQGRAQKEGLGGAN